MGERTLELADAFQFAKTMPQGSVQLILTDPLYERTEDYAWLEREAERVLTPDGNALAFVNAKWLPAVLRACETKLPILSAVQNTSGGMNGRVIAKSYHLLWFGSGVVKRYVADGFVATPWSAPGQHNFKWTKNPKYIAHILEAFTDPGDLVFDPFAGGGSIGAVALHMGRRYIGTEIEPERVEIARAALQKAAAQTQLFAPTTQRETQ